MSTRLMPSSSSSDSESDEPKAKRAKHKKEKKEKKEKKHKKEKKEKKHRDRAPPSEQLTDDDYFRRNAEFQHWLLEDKGIFFDSLPSEEARKRFRKFVAKWNDGELSSKYYSGLKNAPSASATRTAHKWAPGV